MNGVHRAYQNTLCAPERNSSQGRWIVQKFGGTSVGKFAVKIAEDIVKYAEADRGGGQAAD